ncbi:hypothetical protein D6C98_10711 [Aureobasidium pullulans]|nr:hypothetical protein D6C98_10711 [Aureobasidium pullulans]
MANICDAPLESITPTYFYNQHMRLGDRSKLCSVLTIRHLDLHDGTHAGRLRLNVLRSRACFYAYAPPQTIHRRLDDSGLRLLSIEHPGHALYTSQDIAGSLGAELVRRSRASRRSLSLDPRRHRVSFRKGWISASRAIRLVLLMKLHELDMLRGPFDQEIFAEAQQNENTWIVTEERRRTF